MRINHNINALLAWRNLGQTNFAMGKSIERLSSGLRINRAADDAAGLAIATKMAVQIRGLRVAQKNAEDAISLVQTAEGGLKEAEAILEKMHDLALEAANDSKTLDDRLKIQDEINQLIEEIDRIASTTEFNTKKLLNGSVSSKGVSVIYTNDLVSTSADVTGVKAFSTAEVGVYNIDIAATYASTAQATVLETSEIKDGSTSATTTTKLVDLTDVSSNSLGLQEGDVITIRGKVGGEEVFATLKVESTTTYGELMDAIKATFDASDVHIADGAGASDDTYMEFGYDTTTEVGLDKLYIKGKDGRASAITDVEILAETSDGVARTAFNSAFAVTEKQTAKDAGDKLVKIDGPVSGPSDEEVLALRAGEVLKGYEGLEITFGSTIGDGGQATITVARKDGSMTLQIGANQGQTMSISIDDMGAEALGLVTAGQKLRVTTQAAATDAIETIKAAIEKISAQRSKLGAYQNRLEHSIRNLGVAETNLTDAESRMRDADIAQEMMKFTRNQIMLQAGTAMLAQANMVPQTVLQLLG